VDIATRIASAANSAANADVAIVFIGTTAEFESERYDRDTLDLIHEKYQLVVAVSAANLKRGTVVVNYSGALVNMVPLMAHDRGTEAILQAWFLGQECGRSIVSLLMGEINPCGHLPMSWPKRIEDNPSYGNFPAVDVYPLRRGNIC
jgi:beta-glucosidase